MKHVIEYFVPAFLGFSIVMLFDKELWTSSKPISGRVWIYFKKLGLFAVVELIVLIALQYFGFILANK